MQPALILLKQLLSYTLPPHKAVHHSQFHPVSGVLPSSSSPGPCGATDPLVHEAQLNVHVQVKHAEDAGASGAIVYDDVYEALIIMSKPRDHAEPGIPSVFVAQKTGIVMKKLMTPGATIVRITPVSVRSPLPHLPGRYATWQ